MKSLKQNIIDDGYIIIPGLISETEAKSIKDEATYIFTKQITANKIHDGNFMNEADYQQAVFRLFNEKYDSFLGAAKMAQHITALYRLSFSEKIIDLLTEAGLKRPIAATRPIINFNTRHTSKIEGHYKTPPHQDWRSMQGSLNSMVLWITLTDLPSSLGPVEFIPKSHKWGLLETKEDSWFRQIDDKRLAEENWKTSELKAGDAILFSQFLVHRSGNNISDDIRWSIQMRYNDALEKTFIDRNFPQPFTAYKADQEIVTPDFPSPELLSDYWRSL